MLRLALLSLVCAVTCGVFGFGGNSATSSVLAQNLFFLFLVVALAGFLGGTLSGAGEKAYLDQSQMDAT
jgi:uncharacterized membrane protein YtjA (UPF0391 family)